MLEFSSIRDSASTFHLVIVVFANTGYEPKCKTKLTKYKPKNL